MFVYSFTLGCCLPMMNQSKYLEESSQSVYHWATRGLVVALSSLYVERVAFVRCTSCI